MVPPPLVPAIGAPASERHASDYERAYVELLQSYVEVSLRLQGLQRHILRTTDFTLSKDYSSELEGVSNGG